MAISELLRGVTLSEFLEQHFLRLPFSTPGGCEHLRSVATWETIDKILAQPEADVIVGRGGEQYVGERPTSAAGAQALLDNGYTLGIRHADLCDEQLAELAIGFCEEFAAPIDIHVYATPAGREGFGWHYDAEDVFVLQCQGSKTWELRKNTVNPWPLVETLPSNMRHEREIMPVMRCSLAAGDWLYIPAGYWHRTRAGEESISLSIGVLSATALDVFDFLRIRLVDSLAWRQRLPPPGREGGVEALRAVLSGLASDLSKMMAEKDFGATFWAQRRLRLDRSHEKA